MINKPIIMSVPKNAKGNPSDFTVIKTADLQELKGELQAYISNDEYMRAKIKELEAKISRLTR